ncbi:ATP-binding protein [Rhodococcus sp. X156]|uniref:sacsin N-terminal ATP-binding-like domain-containing protein n=1 Tax=Rhodococcus sp. X156 TaxID=2499145 RepID=UPI001F4950CD|nr:ATP-binding protein [Rhodococcus sp. X156]
MSADDPFGLAELRAAVLQAWRRSPTRLREDTATEADLVRGGYRDRVLTELAQNAADAAARAGVPGELTVRLVDGELRVANTGQPLELSGVQALAALRASGKTSGVGRYGVGFTAVLAVSEEPRLLSTTGSVAFSAARTRAELGLTEVPVLRLAWPVAEQPPAGAATEVVLPLREGVDGAALLTDFLLQAPQLLLALPALQRISVDGEVVHRTERELGPGLRELTVGSQRWWCVDAAAPADGAVTPVRWLARLGADGAVVALGDDVLHAPTATDEELSLPAMLITDVPLQPDRRRVLPGTSLGPVAGTYPRLVAAVPPEQRTRLVPLPGFPRSAVDAQLREEVVAALRDAAWLPAALAEDAGPDGAAQESPRRLVAPRAAQVLDVAGPELTALLADVLPGLLDAELSAAVHAPALVALGVPRTGLATLAEELSTVHREPGWWHRLYAALEPLVLDQRAADELAGLPVPLVDGRTVLGPRSTILAEVPLAVPGIRVVHPDAAHPLLRRLGAVPAGPGELLADELLQEVVREADPDDPLAAAELATAVLGLVDAAGVSPGEHRWLGELLLPDVDGELRPADELLLPDAPLAAVLAADAPFTTVAQRVVDEHGPRLLQAVGVGHGFAVLADDDPAGPDHDLDDEQRWWDGCDPEPATVLAVRDLDLVDPARWEQALTLLCAEPETLAALRQPGGYTAWWLRRHAELDGVPLECWRHHDDATFAGLLDPAPLPALPAAVLAGAEVTSTELAALLLRRLADSSRQPSVAVVAGAHSALATAVRTGAVELDELDPPERVRALSGTVVDGAGAAVLDQPWLVQVCPADTVVLGPTGELAADLADVLDLPLASERHAGHVRSAGQPRPWASLAPAVLACAALAVPVPEGVVVLHEQLRVQVGEQTHRVDWWVDDAEVLHAQDSGVVHALLHSR